MLERFLLVSRDDFGEGLRRLILARAKDGGTPIGLYPEREIKKWKGIPNRLFKETTGKVKRAYGVGPPPVAPLNRKKPEVGSEGIVAQLMSELCKEHPRLLLNCPGPDLIRDKKVRRFILVTDFIGSGDRASTYLDAVWRIRSARSWWSARATKGMSFEVVAYSGTEAGIRKVRAHASSPEVNIVAACPTLEALADSLRERAIDLCIRWDPGNRDRIEALGYLGGGALIAFSHGAPNNVPRIFTGRNETASRPWMPLFPRRVTALTRATFTAKEVADRLKIMGQTRLASSTAVTSAQRDAQIVVTVVASLAFSPRHNEHVSRRTGLTVLDVQRAISLAVANNWITPQRRVTDAGRAELKKLRTLQIPTPPLLPKRKETHYYPKRLRGPATV